MGKTLREHGYNVSVAVGGGADMKEFTPIARLGHKGGSNQAVLAVKETEGVKTLHAVVFDGGDLSVSAPIFTYAERGVPLGYEMPEDLGATASKAEDLLSRCRLLGLDLKPKCILAKVITGGTKYVILAEGKVVRPEAETGAYIINLFERFDGSVEIYDIREIEI